MEQNIALLFMESIAGCVIIGALLLCNLNYKEEKE